MGKGMQRDSFKTRNQVSLNEKINTTEILHDCIGINLIISMRCVACYSAFHPCTNFSDAFSQRFRGSSHGQLD